MLTLPFQILTKLCFNENEQMQKLNRNLTEEENFSQCLKILKQITIEDEKELAEREVFQKTINEQILRQRQQTYLEKLLCLLQYLFFFTRTS